MTYRTRHKGLPDSWQSSFITYFNPMQPHHFYATGYIWADYRRGLMRIEGLRSPWDLQATGCQLWQAEVFDLRQKKLSRLSVKYFTSDRQVTYEEEYWERGLIIPQNIIEAWECEYTGQSKMHGVEVEIWTSAKRKEQIFLDPLSGNLIGREIDEPGQKRYKEFPTIANTDIDPVIFKLEAYESYSNVQSARAGSH